MSTYRIIWIGSLKNAILRYPGGDGYANILRVMKFTSFDLT